MDNTIPPDVPQKQCTGPCQRFLPATPEFFCRAKGGLYGLRSLCKQCHRNGERTIKPVTPEGYRWCFSCKHHYPATTEYFSIAKREKGGLNRCCSACRKAKWTLEHPPQEIEVIPEGYKRCSKCREIKVASLEFFCHNRSAKSGLTWWCKECIAHSRQQGRGQKSEYNKRYAQEHKQELSEYDKAYRITYRQRPGVQERERVQSCVRSRQRRARKSKVPGTLTTEQIEAKLKAQKYCCYYCHDRLEKRDGKYIYHLDHTIPISRPEHSPRHDVNYVVLACPPCNIGKKDKLPHEWAKGGRLF